MIKAVFEQNHLRFSSEKNGKTFEVRYSDHPDIFNHPRFLVADFDKAEALVRSVYKQLRESWIIAPKVVLSVEKPLLGGVSEFDRRYLKDIFVHAGAREVVMSE